MKCELNNVRSQVRNDEQLESRGLEMEGGKIDDVRGADTIQQREGQIPRVNKLSFREEYCKQEKASSARAV